jgi:tRNA (guanine37-N1)-methyltransferase
MVMTAQPIYDAVSRILGSLKKKKAKRRVILLTPQGKRLDQKRVDHLSRAKHLVLICGRYEGVDERVRHLVTDEISIGDYVLTGGELPAMVLIDAVTRLQPGTLGDKDSLKSESFRKGLIEYPHYTRPRTFEDMRVPAVLLSGDHEKIEEWRNKQSLKRTRKRRPDLLR